jgi:surface antigen
MRVIALRSAATAALLLAATIPAHAINEMFAKNTAVSKMTQEDFDIAGKVMRKALDEGKDGQAYEWSNAKTSAAGTVTPLAGFEKNGMKCRGVEFKTTAGGKSGQSQWNVCKTAEGWKVLEGKS